MNATNIPKDVRSNSCILESGKESLDMTTKVVQMPKKISKLNFKEIKSFCFLKVLYQRKSPRHDL